MTVEIKFDIDAFLEDCKDVSMEGLVQCAEIIRDEAKQILESKLRSNWTEHGVYQSGPNKGKYWTERVASNGCHNPCHSKPKWSAGRCVGDGR